MTDPLPPRPQVRELLAERISRLGGDYGARQHALADLSAAMRLLTAEAVTTSGSPDLIAAAARLVRDAAALLEPGDHDRPYFSATGAVDADPDDGITSFFDYSGLLGPLNPLAPPLRIRLEGASVIGEVSYGRAYEGPPGCVHGGFIAAGFDEMLGLAQTLGGRPGMTGRLEIKYRRPTPLHTPLRYEAAVHSVHGRKITTRGQLLAGEELCAEGEGLFIGFRDEDVSAVRAGWSPRNGSTAEESATGTAD